MRTAGQSIGLTSVANASNDTLLRLHRVTGGLPLAIKWAIGQIKQEGQALDTVLAALQEARGDVFDRVFTRSWSLLTTEARKVLLIMPMFVAPALQAAIEAASGLHGSVLSEALGQLVRMSLIEATDELDSVRRRYTVHPLTRAYAVSKLRETPALEYEAREGLAEYYGAFTQSNGSFGNWEGFARLDADFPNISACGQLVLGPTAHRSRDPDLLSSLPYLVNRGYWNDAIDLIGTAAEKAAASRRPVNRGSFVGSSIGLAISTKRRS